VLDIYVDGDSCPVKTDVIRVATRYDLQVYMVSNQILRAHFDPRVKLIQVGPEFDAADNWIIAHMMAHDIVVTSDIPLAARCLEKGGSVLNPTGKIFTVENIGSALATREFNSYLRESGLIKGSNLPFSQRDRSCFLQSLDKMIQKLKKQS